MSDKSVISDVDLLRIFTEAKTRKSMDDPYRVTNSLRAVADAAVAADRAARAEPIAWATPAGIAAIHAARLGRADNVQVPLSTYPGGDHSVAVYTTPPAAPVVPEGWRNAAEKGLLALNQAVNLNQLGWQEAELVKQGRAELSAMLAAAPAPSQEPTT